MNRGNVNGDVPLPIARVHPNADIEAFDKLGPQVRAFLNEETRFRTSAAAVLKAAMERGMDVVAQDAKIAQILRDEEKGLPGWSDG